MRFTILHLGFLTNPWLILATAISTLLLLSVIYIPAWAKAFHTVPISLGDWGVALAVGAAGFVLVEVGKWLASSKRPASEPVHS